MRGILKIEGEENSMSRTKTDRSSAVSIMLLALALCALSQAEIIAQTNSVEAEAAARRINTDLRKAVVMGPVFDSRIASSFLYLYNPPDPNAPGPTDPALLDPKSNIALLKKSNTHWVRLWADWPTMQPDPGIDLQHPDFGNYIERDARTSGFIQNLDDQVRIARKEGFGIILTAWRFPLWVNRTPMPCLPRRSDSDELVHIPSDLCPDSDWGKWIDFLVRRYGYSNETGVSGRYVDFLEIVNEPDSQMFPQRDCDGRLMMTRWVATMFKTAQDKVRARNAELAAVLGGPHPTALVLAGPGIADSTTSTRLDRITPYQTFTRSLLRWLPRAGFAFPDTAFVWTQHSYGDIERARDCAPGDTRCFRAEGCAPNDQRCATERVNAAAWVRRTLVVGVDGIKWKGWPRENNPSLLLTEGGARLNVIRDRYHLSRLTLIKNKQAELVEGNFYRMYNSGPLSKGIGMTSNYLTYTDPCFDTGVLDFIFGPITWKKINDNCGRSDPFTGGGGRKRRVYSRWITLPSGP
jgi:hypothetical protein